MSQGGKSQRARAKDTYTLQRMSFALNSAGMQMSNNGTLQSSDHIKKVPQETTGKIPGSTLEWLIH